MSQSVRAIAPAIAIVDGAPTTTSLQVAQHFGKQHEDVLKRIRVLTAETPAEFNAGNFAAVEYTDAKGERRPAYRITRDGFTLLAMGFTGKKALTFKLAYIAAFNRMEAQMRQQALEPPELDVRGRLLSGQARPPLQGYSRRVETAINREAWRMAQEAYELAREHLRRRLAYRHTWGNPAQLHERDALADIRAITLGQCLAQEALDWQDHALRGAQMAQASINKTVARLQDLVDQHSRNRPTSALGQKDES